MASYHRKLDKSQRLFTAIQDNNFRLVQQLLEEGANPNLLLLNDVTPFHLAVAADSTSSYKYVKLILEHNGNPNVRDTEGLTPVHIAAQWDKADCLRLMLKHGANIHLQDKEGKDVYWYAQESPHCQVILEELMSDAEQDSEPAMELRDIFPGDVHTDQQVISHHHTKCCSHVCVGCADNHRNTVKFVPMDTKRGHQTSPCYETDRVSFSPMASHAIIKSNQRQEEGHQNFKTSSTDRSSMMPCSSGSSEKGSPHKATILENTARRSSSTGRSLQQVQSAQECQFESVVGLSYPDDNLSVLSTTASSGNSVMHNTMKISPSDILAIARFTKQMRDLKVDDSKPCNRFKNCIDATSPDNCYMFVKPLNESNSVAGNFNNTTISSSLVSPEGTSVHCDVTPKKQSLSTDNVDRSNKETSVKLLSSPSRQAAINQCYVYEQRATANSADLIDCSADSEDFSTVPISQNLDGDQSTPLSSKSVTKHSSNSQHSVARRKKIDLISDQSQRAMLLGTKSSLHSASCREHLVDDDGSDVIVACRGNGDDQNHEITPDRRTHSVNPPHRIPTSFGAADDATESSSDFSTVPVEQSRQEAAENNDVSTTSNRLLEGRDVRARLQSTCVHDETVESPHSWDLSLIPGEEHVFVHYYEDGSSLVEHRSIPSQSPTGSPDSTLSLPIKLSVSRESDANVSNDETIIYDWKALLRESEFDDVNGCRYVRDDDDKQVIIPDSITNMSDGELRQQLLNYGQQPGPISAARCLYRRRLYLLQKGFKFDQVPKNALYSQEFRSLLLGNALPDQVVSDDQSVRKQFDDPTGSWRGGVAKDNFNYLLLDPRVTGKLPNRSKYLSESDCLKLFAGAIFYVGKGKRSRPYAHFKEALAKKKTTKSAKVAHIHDIWDAGHGVISLHVFQNVVACEAFTREAAMIETMGCEHLTNCVRGKCYGVAAKWDAPRLRRYGAFLLLAAMQILLVEGERQIRPNQIGKNSSRK